MTMMNYMELEKAIMKFKEKYFNNNIEGKHIVMASYSMCMDCGYVYDIEGHYCYCANDE